MPNARTQAAALDVTAGEHLSCQLSYVQDGRLSLTFDETDYLLSSPANAAHLRESIAQMERGETFERNLSDE